MKFYATILKIYQLSSVRCTDSTEVFNEIKPNNTSTSKSLKANSTFMPTKKTSGFNKEIELNKLFNKFFISDLRTASLESESPYIEQFFICSPLNYKIFSPFLNNILNELSKYCLKCFDSSKDFIPELNTGDDAVSRHKSIDVLKEMSTYDPIKYKKQSILNYIKYFEKITNTPDLKISFDIFLNELEENLNKVFDVDKKANKNENQILDFNDNAKEINNLKIFLKSEMDHHSLTLLKGLIKNYSLSYNFIENFKDLVSKFNKKYEEFLDYIEFKRTWMDFINSDRIFRRIDINYKIFNNLCSLIIAIVEYDQFLERIELINENIKYENLNKNTTGFSDKRNNNKLHTENNNSKILENKDSGELLKLNKIQMALHNLCHDVLILVFINNDMNNGNKCLTLGNLEWWNNDKINDFLNIIDLNQ